MPGQALSLCVGLSAKALRNRSLARCAGCFRTMPRSFPDLYPAGRMASARQRRHLLAPC